MIFYDSYLKSEQSLSGVRTIENTYMFDDFHGLNNINHKRGNNISAARAFLKNRYTISQDSYENQVFYE